MISTERWWTSTLLEFGSVTFGADQPHTSGNGLLKWRAIRSVRMTMTRSAGSVR